MIIGVDIGNYAVKTSQKLCFPSKISKVGNILKNIPVTVDDQTIYIGDGSFDTEYRKCKKEHIKALFLYALAKSGDTFFNAVVGLPLSQYKIDKDEYKNILGSQRYNFITIGNESLKLILDGLEVYPEGVASTVGTSFEGIVVDIGGRTTDCCLVTDNGGVKKVDNPLSIPRGTLNLYSDLINVLNSTYSLDLKAEDTEYIIKKGLKVDGATKDCGVVTSIFRGFVEDLVNRIKIEYSIRTRNIALVGGGCELLQVALMNRLPNAQLIPDALYANAVGLKKVGEQLWRS